jgi:hypothetical protein
LGIAMTAEHHAETTVHPYELFPSNEWAAFRHSDAQAATAIVVLITSIFVIGVVLYSIVLYTL